MHVSFLWARVWALATTRTCVSVCEGAQACALEGKGCGAHVRRRVSTRVRACEDVRVCMCVCMCVRWWACVCACGCVRAYVHARE